MLKKQYRGIQASQVSELFDGSAHSEGSRFFRINWIQINQDFPHFVVITPKRLQTSAVVRNRLRRQVYALIEQYFSDWTRGVRVAIVVKNSALNCSPQVFRRHFLSVAVRTPLFSDS